MSTEPRDGMTRFHGRPQIFHMAICDECDMAMPFGDEEKRLVCTCQWPQRYAGDVAAARHVSDDCPIHGTKK